jgi:hypothetical protein
MLWNFEDGLLDDVNERTIRLHIKNLDRDGTWDLLHFRIDGAHSNAYGIWEKMGKPYPLTVEQIRDLRAHDGLELFEPQRPLSLSTGETDLTCVLPMHAVSLMLLVKRQSPAKQKTERAVINKPELLSETGAPGNRQVFIRWAFSVRKDLAGYRVYRKKEGAPSAACINNSDALQCSYYIDTDLEKGVSYTYSVSAVYADGTESPRSPENNITP